MTEMPALRPEGDATPTPTPEEPPLDIHKPKPVHSWREFLPEIGVIGVLMALTGEQLVEAAQTARRVIKAFAVPVPRISVRHGPPVEAFGIAMLIRRTGS